MKCVEKMKMPVFATRVCVCPIRCVPVYQRSSVQVLTQFTAQDSNRRTTHLLGSPDWFVDVTELVLKLLRIEDPHVAFFGPQENIVGLQPGKTSLHVSCRIQR